MAKYALYSAVRLPSEQMACLCVLRARPRFTAAERQLLDLLHTHCAFIHDDTAASIPVQAVELSPRIKETLWKLLSGQGEKQIAAEMGLSRNTVHHYVKAIYKHFDVSSRAELLAWWMGKPGRE